MEVCLTSLQTAYAALADALNTMPNQKQQMRSWVRDAYDCVAEALKHA
jgi:hypothetical protein